MTPFLVPVVLLLLAVRTARRGARQRRVRIERMWIAPTIYSALILWGISSYPPPLTQGSIVTLAIGLGLGLVVGFLRARSVEITIDPESHTLTSATSAWGLVVLAALYLARQALSSYLEGHSRQWQLSPVAVGDATLLFALGAIVGRRIEIFLRSLDLLRQARSGASPTE